MFKLISCIRFQVQDRYRMLQEMFSIAASDKELQFSITSLKYLLINKVYLLLFY